MTAPIKFKPILKQVLWGGSKIAQRKGIGNPPKNIGESWEISGIDNAVSVVCEGEHTGKTLNQLINELGESLMGRHVFSRYECHFPLLFKFIDACQDLSIQVHPNDEMARRTHGKSGKTEMWYVVETDPDAHILTGLSRQITPDEYKNMVEEGTICNAISHYDAHPSDIFFLPAGRIHSIGKGCLIAEIQQASDITYRIFDFNRTDANGNMRELHTELAAQAIDFSTLPDYRLNYTTTPEQETEIIANDKFIVSIIDTTSSLSIDCTETDSFRVLMCVGGECSIVCEDGNHTNLSAFESVLIPASTHSFRIVTGTNVRLLSTHL